MSSDKVPSVDESDDIEKSAQRLILNTLNLSRTPPTEKKVKSTSESAPKRPKTGCGMIARVFHTTLGLNVSDTKIGIVSKN